MQTDRISRPMVRRALFPTLMLAAALTFNGCVESIATRESGPAPDAQPITIGDTIAVPPSPPIDGDTGSGEGGYDGSKDGFPMYSWTGLVRLTLLEGEHYELQTACGAWTLLPANEEVAAKLNASIGKEITVWGAASTNPSIYMRQTIKASNAFGPGDPMIRLYVPAYPCGDSKVPPPPPEATPAPAGVAGTVYGQVRIGPMCPVEPCDRPTGDLYSSRQLVLTSAGGDVMFIPLTDTGGFKSLVKPGTYKATVSNCEFMGCKYSLPSTITISSNQATYLELDIDTAIR